MKYHLDFIPPISEHKISHQHKLLLMGSCFAENIGEKLIQHKFITTVNPNGILFNPISISKALNNYVDKKSFDSQQMIQNNNLFYSFDHHGSFAAATISELEQRVNSNNETNHDFLKTCHYLFISFGTANVYKNRENNQVVANCHKIPQTHFLKYQLSPHDIISAFKETFKKLKNFNPNLKIIFSISPVKYLKDGLIENNYSKAVLIYCVHELVKEFYNCTYFPAYELITDDLRDYRFFKQDMAHPNQQAIDYVWEKLSDSYFEPLTKVLNKEINEITKAMHHRPISTNQKAYHLFKESTLSKLNQLVQKHPDLNFEQELKSFSHS